MDNFDPLLLTAALQLLPSQEGQPRRFEFRAYDGGLLRVPNYSVPVVVDLTGLKPRPDQVKVLLEHNSHDPAGYCDHVDISPTEIRASGVFTFDGAQARIEAAATKGFQWDSSVGCFIDRNAVETVPPGQSRTVNGRVLQGPFKIARRSLLNEISFTGLGAGEGATANLVASLATSLTLEDEGSMPDTTLETTVSELQASVTTLVQNQQKRDQQLDEFMKTWQQERQASRLQAHLAKMCQGNGLSIEQLTASLGSTPYKDLLDKIQSGKSNEAEIELAVVKASAGHRTQGYAPYRSRAQDAPATVHVLEAAFMRNAGWNPQELAKYGGFDDDTIAASLGKEFQGFGLQALASESLRAHGHSVWGGAFRSQDIEAAIECAQRDVLQASAGAGTISLPGLLSNVARKTVLMAYEGNLKIIPLIAARKSASDYKPFKSYRLLMSDGLKELGANGQMESMTLGEQEFASQVKPWGRFLQLTEVMLRNDDAGGFNGMNREFGRMAAYSIEFTGVKTVIDNQSTFFHANRGNRISGALSLATLKAAYAAFMNQGNGLTSADFATTKKDIPISVDPKYILTAAGDAYITALELNKSTTIAVTTGTDATVEKPDKNILQGMFEPLKSPLLNDGRLGNGTQFILLADPNDVAILEVAYLDGVEAPRLKRWEAIPGQRGIQVDIAHDFGFNLGDYRGGVYSPGT